MRENLIQTFLKEKPGTGTGDNASRYHYNVERFGDYGIFLKRPTQLNKGFDFTVNIDGLFFKKNRRYSNPSQTDCKTNFPHIYPSIAQKLHQIYDCDLVSLVPSGATFCDYAGNEHPIEIILLAVKWLLMEQLKIDRTPHCCRHTCISMLAEAGVDQTIIKKIVGHSGAMTLTEKVYTHFDVKELVNAINKI